MGLDYGSEYRHFVQEIAEKLGKLANIHYQKYFLLKMLIFKVCNFLIF